MAINIKQLNYESDKILSALTRPQRLSFIENAVSLTFKKGKLIFYEGGVPTGIFLVEKGKAKIYKTGIYGKDQIFYIYKPGDLFGYHGLLANEVYEDSCEAIEDCEILFINKMDFEYSLNTIPNLKELFIMNMSHEFGVLVNTITILAQKPLRERLALNLLVLQERYFDEMTGQSWINLPREDLANIIGTARESLGRLLKDFKEAKLIRVNGRVIEILDAAKLEVIANG